MKKCQPTPQIFFFFISVRLFAVSQFNYFSSAAAPILYYLFYLEGGSTLYPEILLVCSVVDPEWFIPDPIKYFLQP